MQLDPTISIGNIVTIIGGVISVIVLWVRLGDRVETVEKSQAKQGAVVDEMVKLGIITNQSRHDLRLHELEQMFREFHAIRNDIIWIKHTLRSFGKFPQPPPNDESKE